MFLNYNDKIIKVLILIYDYYFIFENRYLDFFKNILFSFSLKNQKELYEINLK